MSNSPGSNGAGAGGGLSGDGGARAVRRSSPGWPAPGCRWRRAWRRWPRSCPGAGSAARWSTWPAGWRRAGRWARRSRTRSGGSRRTCAGWWPPASGAAGWARSWASSRGYATTGDRAEAAALAEPGLSDPQPAGHAGGLRVRRHRRGAAVRGDLPRLRHPAARRSTLSSSGSRQRTSGIWPTLMVIAGLGGRPARWRAYLFLPTGDAARPGGAGAARWAASGGGRRWPSSATARPAAGASAADARGPAAGGRGRAGLERRGPRPGTWPRTSRTGKTLAEAMAGRRPFPPRLPRLLRWGEKQGTLPEVLHMAGDMFAARASAHSTFAAAALSVACFVLILLGVNLDRPRVDAPHDQPDQPAIRMIAASPPTGRRDRTANPENPVTREPAEPRSNDEASRAAVPASSPAPRDRPPGRRMTTPFPGRDLGGRGRSRRESASVPGGQGSRSGRKAVDPESG